MMAKIRNPLTLTLLVAFVALCAQGLVRPTTYTHRSHTLGFPVITLAPTGPSASAFAALLEAEGGLPKTSVPLTNPAHTAQPSAVRLLPRMAGQALAVFPVSEWSIVRTTVEGGNLIPLAIRGELAYDIEMDIQVRYRDGDTALVQWSAWGYGLALGPFALNRDEPAGDLVIVEASWQ